jgi:hypothetical protein
MRANPIQSVAARAASTDGHVGAAAVGKAPGASDPVSLILDNRGMIRDCSGDSETLFKYRHDELIKRHVSLLLPELETLELVRNGEPNHRLRFQCRIGHHFAAVTRDGVHFASKLFLNLLDSSGEGRLSLIVRPTDPAVHSGYHAWQN